MNASQNVGLKRYSLFAAAILLLLAGGVGIYLGSDNYLIRVLGLVSILASLNLVRISRVHGGSSLPTARGRESKIEKGSGRLLRVVSLALVLLLGASGFLLHIDAANGGHSTWPADLFAGVSIACAIVWGYIGAKKFGASGRPFGSS
jgi:hypothetical protein